MEVTQEVVSKYRLKKVLKISILALLFFVIGLLIFEYFRITPRNVYFSNVTSSSVTVSWNTKNPTSATVIPFEGNSILPIRLFCLFREKFFDTRDVKKAELEAASQAGLNRDGYELSMNDFQTELVITDAGRYYTHHVVVNGLEPEKEYSFLVGDSILYRKVSEETKTSVQTLSVPDSILTPYPVYGVIQDAQNKDEPSSNELENITDGVLYFNYLDKKSGDKSNLFSSSLSENGTWYIDASGAVSQDGNNFIDTYSDIDSEILLELVVDAGNKGIWKSKRHNITSPAEPFILNMPNSILDKEEIGPVIKTSLSRNSLINKIFAAPEKPADCNSECQFINFCGPCQNLCNNGYWYPCTCSETTLAARQCAGYEPEPENDVKCNGGHNIGDYFKDGTACYECYRVYSGTYYYAGTRRVSNDKCEQCTTITCEDVAQKDYLTSCPAAKQCNKIDNVNIGCNKTSTCYEIDSKTCETINCEDVAQKDYFTSCPENQECNKIDNVNIGCNKTSTCYEIDSPTCETINCENVPNTDYYTSCPENNECNKINNVNIGCNKTSTCYKIRPSENYCSLKDPNYLEATEACPKYKECLTIYVDDGLGGYRKCKRVVTGETIDSCPDINTNYLSDRPADSEDYSIEEKQINGLTCYLKVYSCNYLSKGTFPKEQCSDTPYFRCYSSNYGGKPCYREVYTWVNRDPEPVEVKTIKKWDASNQLQCPTTDDDGNKISFCFCINSTSVLIKPGRYCAQVNTLGPACILGSEGKICQVSIHKYTCQSNGVIFQCLKSQNQGNVINPNNKFDNVMSILGKFKKNIFAETAITTENQYIIDPKTGLFVDLPIGIYVFEYNGITYSVEVITTGANTQLQLYIDKNENGSFEEGIDIDVSKDASTIVLTPLSQSFNYAFKQGYNFVSFPFKIDLDGYVGTAVSLLQYLNSKSLDNVYSISQFDGSWKIVGQNDEIYGPNDFQILPGKGYVIKSKNDFTITLNGQPVKFETTSDQAPVTFYPGWNLIGVYGSKAKVYTAKTLLQDINTFDKIDFTGDIVNGWDQDVQAYEGFVLDTESGIEQEYGFDFPINTLKSYFVRINNGSGNWEPKLAE